MFYDIDELTAVQDDDSLSKGDGVESADAADAPKKKKGILGGISSMFK